MAASTQEKRYQRVMDRLRFTKQVYTDKGILEKNTAPASTLSHFSTMQFLMNMYRGKQWDRIDGWGGLSDEDQLTVNKVFALANQFEAEVAARPPDVALLPRGRTLVDEKKAARSGVVQALLNYDIEELGFEEQATDAFSDNLFAPFGAVRHMFTPREEHTGLESGKRLNWYRHEKPDKPFIRRYAPWDCLLDPNAQRFSPDGGMRYVFFRDFYTIEQIRQNPKMVLRKNLKDMAGAFRGRIDERPSPADIRRQKLEDPDDSTIVEVWTYYDAIDRSWMQVVEDGIDKPIRDEEEWTLAWEWLPVSVFVANRQRNSPFGVPLLEPIADLQEELNRVRSMISWLARAIRRLIGVDESRMDPAEIGKLETAALTEILKVNGPLNEIVQNLQSGTLPQELLLYEARIEQDMRETLGLSLPGRGQRVNVESATEASNIQLGQDVNVGRVVKQYEKFWQSLVTTYFQARRETMEITGREIVRLLGTDADGALSAATVDPAELHGDYDFVVVPNSTRRRNPAIEEQVAMLRYQMAANNPNIFNQEFYATQMVAAQRFDPSKALQRFSGTASALSGVADVSEQAQRARGAGQPGGSTATSGSGDAGTAFLQVGLEQ